MKIAIAAAAIVLGLAIWTVVGIGAVAVVVGVVAATVAVTLVDKSPMMERIVGWKHPTLEFTHWPVELGSRVGVTYRRQPLNAQALADAVDAIEVEAEIVCEEWVEYTVGTETHSERHDVVEIELAEPARRTDAGIEATFWFTVPTDVGAPTMELGSNRIRWYIENELEGSIGRRTETRVDFVVAPALDRDAVVGEETAIEGGEP